MHLHVSFASSGFRSPGAPLSCSNIADSEAQACASPAMAPMSDSGDVNEPWLLSSDDEGAAAATARANAADPSGVPREDETIDIRFTNAFTGTTLGSIRRKLPSRIDVAEIRREIGLNLHHYTSCLRDPIPRGGRRLRPPLAYRRELRCILMQADGHGEHLDSLVVERAWARHGVANVPLLRRPNIACRRCRRTDRPAGALLLHMQRRGFPMCLHCCSVADTRCGSREEGECERCGVVGVTWPVWDTARLRQCTSCTNSSPPWRYDAMGRIRRRPSACYFCGVRGTYLDRTQVDEVCSDCYRHAAAQTYS